MNALRSHPLRILAAVLLAAGALAMLAGFVVSTIDRSKKTEAVSHAPESGADVAALMARLQQEPNDGKTLFELGKVFFDAREYPRASNFLGRAAISSPSDPSVWYWLGVSRYYEKKYAESAEALESSLSLKKDPDTMFNLGLIYKHGLEQSEKARAMFEELSAMEGLPRELKAKVQNELNPKP